MVVLGFITVGAVLRNVNLLLLMSGLMFGLLIINWRVGVFRLKTLSARRLLPHRVHANQLANVQWVCENRSHVSAWGLEVRDAVNRDNSNDVASSDSREASNSSLEKSDLTNSENAKTKRPNGLIRLIGWLKSRGQLNPNVARVGLAQVAPYKSEAASYRVYFSQRGRYEVGNATLSTSFPFGLVESRIHMPVKEQFFVAPALGTLTPTWERRVQSAVVGSEAIKRKRGMEEDEFYALRPWRSGDSKKHIHWRTSAKYGLPIVKQHDQQDNRDFAILLDLYGDDSRSEIEKKQDCELILRFAATVLMNLGSAVQGRIGVGVCGHESDVCHSRNHREIVDQAMQLFSIAQFQRDDGSEAGFNQPLATCLLQIAKMVSASTPLYVISTRSETEAMNSFQSLPNNSEAFATELRIQSQLKAIGSQVRWITVDSDEFAKLYSDVPATDQEQVSALAEKWKSDHVTG